MYTKSVLTVGHGPRPSSVLEADRQALADEHESRVAKKLHVVSGPEASRVENSSVDGWQWRLAVDGCRSLKSHVSAARKSEKGLFLKWLFLVFSLFSEQQYTRNAPVH